MPRSTLLASLLLAASAATQSSIVIPPAFTSAPALATSAYPLGVTAVHRAQYCYAPSETGLASATLLKSMEMRSYQLTASVAKTLTMQIEMSTTSAVPTALSATFATNRGANHMVVFTSKPVNLPATTTGFLGQWSGPMLFDANFSYDPAAGNLLCEFDVAATASTTWAQNVTNTAAGIHFTVGTPCGTFVGTSSGGGVGGTLTYSASGGAASNPAVLVLGTLELPSPIPLPGNPTCQVHQSLDATVGATLSATGTASLVFPVPAVQQFRGVSLFGQWVEINASSLLESTVSRRAVLQGLHAVGRCYSLSSNTSPTGTPQANVGLVLRLGV